MKTVLLIVLTALSAFAAPDYNGFPATRGRGTQGSAAFGSITSNSSFATQSALTLYVDPTGNDSNACTSSGTGACLTYAGALSKFGKLIRHPVTINGAAGSYTGFLVQGYVFDPVSVTNGAYIDFVGTLSTATATTGSATGTATAGSAGSGSTFGSITNSGETWTSNDFKGKILETLTGTGSGQTRVICSNTGTVITVCGTWTAPASGTTYAVRDWGTVINTALNQPAIPGSAAGSPVLLNVNGNGTIRNSSTSAGSPIRFNRMKFAPGSSGQSAVRVLDSQVGFFESSLNGNTTGVGLFPGSGASIQLTVSYLTSGSTNALSMVFATAPTPSLVSTNCLYESAGGPVVNLNGIISFSGTQVNSTASSGSAVIANGFSGTTTASFSGTNVSCTSGASTVGVHVGGLNAIDSSGTYTTGSRGVASYLFSGGTTTTNCPTAVRVVGRNAAVGFLTSGAVTFTGTGTNTALQAVKGGYISVGPTPTFTSVTTETDVDGTTATFATVLGLTPTVQASNYGSGIGR